MMYYDLNEVAERTGASSGIDLFAKVLNVVKPNFAAGPWIAGGCLRRLVEGKNPIESDVDIFFNTEAQKDAFISRLINDHDAQIEYRNEFNTTLTVRLPRDGDEPTWSVKIQAVHIRYFICPDDVLDSFDYTICQLLTDGTDLMVGPYTLWDIARKRLVVHRVTYGVATLRRLIKYTQQGYYACQGTLTALLSSAVENPNIIQEEIRYID